MLGGPKKGKMIDPADTQLWEEIKRLPPPEHPTPLPLLRATGQPLPEGIQKTSPGVVVAWSVIPVIALCLSFFGIVGGLVAVIASHYVITYAKNAALRSSPLAELKSRRIKEAREAQSKVDACLDKLYLMSAGATISINQLKAQADDYYKQLKDISLMPSPVERAALVAKLRYIYDNVLHISRETKNDMLQVEEQHRQHRKALMQAGADLQVVKLAEDNHRDDPFFQAALIIGIVAFVYLGLRIAIYAATPTPTHNDWSHPAPTPFNTTIDLPNAPFPNSSPAPQR
jgi:hypothetical protein